jgi:hypothetical protein
MITMGPDSEAGQGTECQEQEGQPSENRNGGVASDGKLPRGGERDRGVCQLFAAGRVEPVGEQLTRVRTRQHRGVVDARGGSGSGCEVSRSAASSVEVGEWEDGPLIAARIRGWGDDHRALVEPDPFIFGVKPVTLTRRTWPSCNPADGVAVMLGEPVPLRGASRTVCGGTWPPRARVRVRVARRPVKFRGRD